MLFSSVRSCREAAALILAREDRPLAWGERSRLAMHLHICKDCPRFAAQVDLLRGAFGRWRRQAESEAGGGDAEEVRS